MKLERYVEGYVYEMVIGNTDIADQTWAQRFAYARDYVIEIIQKVWIYVLIGVGFGAFMHGYAPADLLLNIAGKSNPFAVPIAVLIGVPLYSNAAGVIPIVKVLMEKGMAIGTALAFMMAVTALSFPEAIILRKVLKLKLLIIYFSVVAMGIIITGYMFNWIL